MVKLNWAINKIDNAYGNDVLLIKCGLSFASLIQSLLEISYL